MPETKYKLYLNKLQSIQEQIITPNLGLKSIISAISVALFMLLAPTFVWISPLLVLFLFYALDIETKSDKIRAIKHIRKAKKILAENDLVNFTKELIAAYTNYPATPLDKLLIELTELTGLEEYYDRQKTQMQAKHTKDENLKEILNQKLKVQNYLSEHSNQLKQLNTKLTSLYKELLEAPEKYKPEIQNLINRYKKLISLEESKIEFYREVVNELDKLYKEFIYRNKLENEYKFLKQIEDQVLTKSIQENYTTDDNKDFIEFQRLYIQELSKLAQEANSSDTQELFENIRKDFEQKRNDLSKAN